MNQYAKMIRELKTPAVMKRLTALYGQRDGMLVGQIARYTRLLKRHEELVNTEAPVMMISAPGRTEIGGNHTDHNHGKVLAAAVNLDTLAAVSRRGDMQVRVFSEGYGTIELILTDLNRREDEEGTTIAIIRGIAAKFLELGYHIGGFDATISSLVASGSGLSSSAAFEVLVCAIFDALFNEWSIDAKVRAQISQYAENVYFGKPSGLMDQMASSMGSLTFMDFKDRNPKVTDISVDFAKHGLALVVINTGGSHDDLTPDYAAIPHEMKAVAACFGEKTLRRVRPEQFLRDVGRIRETAACENVDRAILRAAHYFAENLRASQEAEALQNDDMEEFLKLVIESGRSSFTYLQNVYSKANRQELALALMLAEKHLQGKGAWRIHGGGFAGTTLNFVPQWDVKAFVGDMEAVFGPHSCNVLDIRPEGAACILLNGQD